MISNLLQHIVFYSLYFEKLKIFGHCFLTKKSDPSFKDAKNAQGKKWLQKNMTEFRNETTETDVHFGNKSFGNSCAKFTISQIKDWESQICMEECMTSHFANIGHELGVSARVGQNPKYASQVSMKIHFLCVVNCGFLGHFEL